VAWASGIGASFRALAGGIDAPEVDLATMLASVLDASTAAPVPLLDPTAELLEALFESSRAQGEPWSTAALEAFALSTAASAKASADAASLALARRAVAAVAQGSSDGNDDEAAGEAAGAAAVARLRACVVLVSADAARTRRGGPGSFALLDALAHGAGLPGSQWRPSRTSPGAPTCLRRASAVCLNYWGRADFRSSHTTTHPALVGGEAHQALLGRLLAPSVHAPPSVGAATAASDAGDDEDVDEDELSEWHSFREQDVADALSACHLALGSGTYLQAVLATLHAAVAASPATSPPHVDEGGDEMPAFALFAMRVVAIEASRRALLAQAPEATLMAATKRDPRLNNSNNNSSSGASSSAGSSSPADVARADARAADAALLEVVSMLLAASNPSHASGGVGSAGAGVEVVVVVASSADAWSVANSLVAGEACRLLAVLARWLMEAPSAQQAQLLPRALEFALGPALGPFPSSSSHGWVQQHRASNGSTNTSSNSSTAGSPAGPPFCEMQETRGGPLVPCRAVRPSEEWLNKEVERAAEIAAQALLEKRKEAQAAATAAATSAWEAANRARTATYCATGLLYNQTGADHATVLALQCCPGRCPSCGAHACGKLGANNECCGRFKEPCMRPQADACTVPPESASTVLATQAALTAAGAELERLDLKPKNHKSSKGSGSGLHLLPGFGSHHHHHHHHGSTSTAQEELAAPVVTAGAPRGAAAAATVGVSDVAAQRAAAKSARDALAAQRSAAAEERAKTRMAGRVSDRGGGSASQTSSALPGNSGFPSNGGISASQRRPGGEAGERGYSVLESLQDHKGRGPGSKASALEGKVRRHSERAAEKQIEADIAAAGRASAAKKVRSGEAYV